MEVETASPNPKSATFRRGRKGKRPRCTEGVEGDGCTEDGGGRHRKKSKTFDTGGSKLVRSNTEVPSTSTSTASSHAISTPAPGGSGVSMTDSQKRRMKPEALGPNNASYVTKMIKMDPESKTDASEAEQAVPELIEAVGKRKSKESNPAVTIEDIGSEEGEFASKYRDPLGGDSDSDKSENESGSFDDDDEDSNSEGNWKNEYPDDASDFEHDYDRECSSSADDSESGEGGDFDDEDGDRQRFRGFNRKVTDQDIAACSSKLGKMLKNFHKENGPVQVSPDSSRHASASYSLNPYGSDFSDDDDDCFGDTRGHGKSRFIDDGLADEVVSSASETE